MNVRHSLRSAVTSQRRKYVQGWDERQVEEFGITSGSATRVLRVEASRRQMKETKQN